MKIYHIDTFTDRIFSGNPAAVCILDEWIEDRKMQLIAFENNLSETAFVVKKDNIFEIKWFTPTVEVDLCGHATLAAAHVLYRYHNFQSDFIVFSSRKSGILKVYKKKDSYTLDFPTDEYYKADVTEELKNACNIEPIEVYKGKTDYLLIYSNEIEIETAKPNFEIIKRINSRGIIISAKGKKSDFVSRFFGPNVGIDEDPVTGSAHTLLIPVWSEKLKKEKLSALQLSKRKGKLECELNGNRVKITGKAVTYLIGVINL